MARYGSVLDFNFTSDVEHSHCPANGSNWSSRNDSGESKLSQTLERRFKPSTLNRSWSATFLLISGDIVGFVLWLGILVYALVLWLVNGRTVSTLTFDAEKLFNIAKPLSTMFTILFAATVGRTVRSAARWFLERGNTIEFLDRLIGSSTVGGTIISNVLAGIPTLMPTKLLIAILLIVWTLSPLGSQAVLRIMSVTPHRTNSTIERHYLNTSRWESLPGAGSSGQLDLVSPNALLTAAMISTLDSKGLAADIWGHVKIPRFQDMDVTKADTQGWIPVGNMSYKSYSSLVGIPIGSLLRNGSSFASTSIESWYWNIQCDPWLALEQDSNATELLLPYNFRVSSSLYASTQAITVVTSKQDLNRVQNFCGVDCPKDNGVLYCPNLPARELGIMLRDGYHTFLSKCRFDATYVETEVLCEKEKCYANRIRPSQLTDLPPANWTVFDSCFNSSSPLESGSPLYRFGLNIADAFVSSTDGGKSSNIFAAYISTPETPLNVFRPMFFDGVTRATDEVIDRGLAQVFNTYWITNLATPLLSGIRGDDFEYVQSYGMSLSGRQKNTSLLCSTNATITTEEDKFTCDLVWLSIFTVSILTALVACVTGMLLAVLTQGPRLNFNVSTLARNNPNVCLPFQGSWLDDDDRSRAASNVLVAFGDVAPWRKIGHISLGTVTNAIKGPRVRMLREGRFYD